MTSGNTYAGARFTWLSFQGTYGTTAERPDIGTERLNGSLTLIKMRQPSTLWPTSSRTNVAVALWTRRPTPYDLLRFRRSRSATRDATLPASTKTAASTWVNKAQRDSALNASMSLS